MEQRTNQQRKAIEVYCKLLAEALDREGVTLQNVTARIKKAEIRPTQENIKEVVFKPMCQALLNKQSTTELTTAEVDRVYEMVNAFVGREWGLHIPFPKMEDLLLAQEDYEQTNSKPMGTRATTETRPGHPQSDA